MSRPAIQNRAAIAVICTFLAGCVTAPPDPGFDYYVTGNAGDVVTPTNGLLVLQGGGDDVDYNYQRMGELAGGGDFVVLRASGADDYNDYVYALCECDSVETIVFRNRHASYNPFLMNRIRNAEALFIAGGDQSNYVRLWKGTPVEDAIHFVAGKPAPIGGTSAGMAVMGEFSYSAMSPESLTSAAALGNPYHPDLTLETDFLKFAGMENIITDQHLIERDRIGRTITLLARLVRDGRSARAIAADRETSLHIDPASGNAEVFATPDHATPYVYFLSTTESPSVCRPNEPLTLHDIPVYRISPGASFNIRRWSGSNGLAYSINVEEGRLSSAGHDIY